VDDASGTEPDEAAVAASNGTRSGRRTSTSHAAETVGGQLREAREKSGMALEDVSMRTKVRPGILRAIEADQHDALPALTYTLGFVKAYARTVGLEPDRIAERYRSESQKGEPVPSLVMLEPLDAGRTPSRRLVGVSAAALVLVLGLFWAWGAGWLTPPPPTQPETPGMAQADLPDAQEDEIGAATTDVPADASTPVRLVAKDEVWLRIADGRDLLYMGTLTAGQSLDLPPGKDWKLRTGRAGALEVQVGGKAVAPLGGPAEQVRDVSLSPLDLQARGVPDSGGLAPTVAIAPNA
jgi:transcriptional regulator with XRE-family HTH domain